jgi:hypothetical protein
MRNNLGIDIHNLQYIGKQCQNVIENMLSVFEKFLQNEASACEKRNEKIKLSLCVLESDVATQHLGTHVPAATNTLKTTNELLDGPFSTRSVSDQRKVGC